MIIKLVVVLDLYAMKNAIFFMSYEVNLTGG